MCHLVHSLSLTELKNFRETYAQASEQKQLSSIEAATLQPLEGKYPSLMLWLA